MRRNSVIGFGIALLATTTLVACGSKDTSVDASKTSSNSAVTDPSTTTSTAPPSTTPATDVSVPATSPKRYLTDAKLTRSNGHDVLTFTFNDGTPGYSAQYITPPITDEGQGKPVSISGNNVMKLVFESAGTVDLSNNSKNYYNGQNRFGSPDTTNVSEVVKVSEFEGRLEFGIGTSTKSAFVVKPAGNTITITFD